MPCSVVAGWSWLTLTRTDLIPSQLPPLMPRLGPVQVSMRETWRRLVPARTIPQSASGAPGLELTQRAAHVRQRVPVLTGRTVLRRLRRLAGVGDRVPELAIDAIQRVCRSDPGAEQRHGGNGSGRENGDGATAKQIWHGLILPAPEQRAERNQPDCPGATRSNI